MKKKRILWADDEIDILRPHILFLEEKGYEVVTANSGLDALDCFNDEIFDIVFLDENMPGLTGLQTLDRIKEADPGVPVIMITKSEDEGIMTHAIGKKIADYLIKPINPNQILLSLKKNLHKDDIVSEVVLENYRENYVAISQNINNAQSVGEWTNIYRKLVQLDAELTNSENPLLELLHSQMQEADAAFCKFVKKNYELWMQQSDGSPLLSFDVLKKKVFPLIDNGEKVLFVLIDNFRFDQWYAVKELLANYFSFTEDTYYSILPTATQYARNAIFAGITPAQLSELYPELWVNEEDEEGKNIYEEKLLEIQLKRLRKNYSFSYHKISSSFAGEKIVQGLNNMKEKDLCAVVINFVDMLSHARTESKMIRELAADEAAYRSLTLSWFKHSSAIDLIKKAAEHGFKIILTTDHGTIRVKNAVNIVGDRSLNSNIRYKVGKNIGYDRKQVYDVLNPQKVGLPSSHISTKYIFATNNDFFSYQNNHNQYASYYNDTFQHGGISMEEMIIPLITLTKR